MIQKAPKRLFAAFVLLILFSAHLGQGVHIFREDPACFAALNANLLSAADAHAAAVSMDCPIDDFYFFPCLDAAPAAYPPCTTMQSSTILPEAIRCHLSDRPSGIALRGPPAV